MSLTITSAEPVNPLLSALKLPGRIFPLPSGGLFYHDGELASNAANGEVHVQSMSGISEMKFRSPDLLYSGKAVCDVIRECVPDILKPEKLVSRDTDAVLGFIKLVTYGVETEVKYKHNCENAKEHSYMINLEQICSGLQLLTESDFKMYFSTTLTNGQEITLTPLKWEDAIQLVQLTNMPDTSTNDIDQMWILNITGIIAAIDGITDKKLIEEWVKVAPAPFTNQIQESIKTGLESWKSKLEAKIQCADCGAELTLPLDLNPTNFFTQ